MASTEGLPALSAIVPKRNIMLLAQRKDIGKITDYYARSASRMLVVAAGNKYSDCPYDYVESPARAWNVVAVGAYDDGGNANWSNDVMADFSQWKDNLPSSDRDKPEVVAPGVSISGVGIDGKLALDGGGFIPSGTSFAAPHVAGEAALLMHRNATLYRAPMALKAIIMASATHNIEGPSGIPTGVDLKDGAGGINADLADITAKTQKLPGQTCDGSCWWLAPINASTPQWSFYSFNAKAGDRIRSAISWWSNADCSAPSPAAVGEVSCAYDQLDTDLSLGIYDPSGTLMTGALSSSWNNNYELVPPATLAQNAGWLVLPTTGTYSIRIEKKRLTEATNSVGIALVKASDSSPAVSSWGANRLDVFARGTDNAIWRKFWNGSAWSAWVSNGGILASGPDSASWGTGRIDAFAQGMDNSLQQLYWTGSA